MRQFGGLILVRAGKKGSIDLVGKKASEEDILRVFVEELETRGYNRMQVQLDIDESMLERINRGIKGSIDLSQLYRLVDRCLASEWLEYTVIGAGKYGQLSLTATGLGIVRSRQRKEKARASRTRLKIASDYIEEHKGLFLLIGAAVAITGLFVKILMA